MSTHRMPKRAPQPELCMLSHDMTNCVSIILGECDLLYDLLIGNTPALKRLSVISQTAYRMSSDMNARPCPRSQS